MEAHTANLKYVLSTKQTTNRHFEIESQLWLQMAAFNSTASMLSTLKDIFNSKTAEHKIFSQTLASVAFHSQWLPESARKMKKTVSRFSRDYCSKSLKTQKQ